MYFGFKEDSLVKTHNSLLSLNKVNKETQILILEDFNKKNTKYITSKDTYNINRCLKISFYEEQELICSQFVNIYSVSDNKFIPAYSIKKNTIIKGFDNNLIVKDVNIVFNVLCVNLNFDNKPIYFINNVLCHSHEDYSDFELNLKKENQLIESDMSQIYKILSPNRIPLNTQIKFLDNKWRKSIFLDDNNFEKDFTGYLYNQELTIKICIDKLQLKDNYIFFNYFGDDVDFYPLKCRKFNNKDQWFFVFDLNEVKSNKDTVVLEYAFKTKKESFISNCILINKFEYNLIDEYFQGLLVAN